MEKVKGYIDHIIFRNEDNGYTVFELGRTQGSRSLTCVGTLPQAVTGMSIEAGGEYITHAVYGRQFRIDSYEEKTPQDRDGIERYLGSGAIRGIGPALAARIVRLFSDDTLRVIEDEPEKLVQVKGISRRMAEDIASQFREKAQMRKAMVYLQKYGISLSLGVRIYQKYGSDLYGILQENPYRLAEDIRGVGFMTADEIAGRIGIHVDSDYRIHSGILYCLSLAQSEGNCYLPKEKLFARAERLLGVSPAYMEKHVMDLALEGKAVLKERGESLRVYPSNLYYLELDTARLLNELNISFERDRESVRKRLEAIETGTGIELEKLQKESVMQAFENGVFILTGGPGTGKTTTINAMIRLFESEGLSIRLAAPTGRAAKRMTEASGREASTIHRLLELSAIPDDEEQDQPASFARNAQNPLKTDVIIIDEMSMVDIYLMHSLLEAVVPGTILVLVGDENQLPSVGPGNVLRDMIRSGSFSVVELTKIFRQASHSDIVVNAHKINRGEQIPLDNRSKDFFFLKRSEAAQVLKVLLVLIQEKLPPYVEAKPYDIQVLTPMRKGVLGVENLNRILQQYLNPPDPSKIETEQAGRIFRTGDKVMQIRNNYQMEWELQGARGVVAENGLGVFNGDMGVIRSIDDFNKIVTVVFEENRFADYEYTQLEELELAYAVTVHKSQGSEYPAVILPLLGGPQMLMNRNLLYTAVTRAKKCVTIVGNEEAVARMISNESQILRYSSLDERLREFRSESFSRRQTG